MGKKKIYSLLLVVAVMAVATIFVTMKQAKIEAISDPSVLSITQDTDSFYVDAAAPNNIHTINLAINNAVAGEVVSLDLDGLTLNQAPIVKGATVKLSGSILTFTFTDEVSGSVEIPVSVKATYTNVQRKLSDIQTAIANNAVPGEKNIVATTTRAGDTYESTLTLNAELTPYSVPIELNDIRTFSGAYVQNREYTMTNWFTGPYANDGLAHVALSSETITPLKMENIPGDFVLTGGTGWIQSGTTLTYDGTGDGKFTGHFTGAIGTYTIPVNSITVTAYFGYDTTPVVLSNPNKSYGFQIIAPTPVKPPTLGILNSKNEVLYKIDPSLLLGRTVPADVPASFTATFNTNDPSLVTSGDNTVASAHWTIDNQKAPNLTFIETFTVPNEAIHGAVVTFLDGTTKTYPAGTVVSFDDPESNYVLSIAMDFGPLPNNLTISMPIKYYFQDTSVSKGNQGLPNNVTGTYTNGGTFNPGGTHAYGPGLNIYRGLTSGTVLDGIAAVARQLQYGGTAAKYNTRTTGGSSGNPLTNDQLLGVLPVYEPISYVVLPLGVNYQGVTGGLAGYTVSTYTISTGQVVVKIDYTGSEKLVGVVSSDWPAINYIPKPYGLSKTSMVYCYMSAKNDPVMTLRPYGGTAPSAELTNEITQGDEQAIFSCNAEISIDGSKYLNGSSYITSNNGITGHDAVNDLVYGTNHSITIDLLNSTESDAGALESLTNLPDVSDGLTLNLTGPGVLKNIVTGNVISDSTIGEILYSTSKQTFNEGSSIDDSGYVSADEISDWSKVQSFIVVIKEMNAEIEYTAEFPLTAPDAIHQLNKPVAIDTLVVSEGLNSIMTSNDEFIALVEIVHGTVSYDANTGIVSSLPANQTTEDFLDVDTDNHPVTLSSTKPTKNADAYYTYTFKEWNTKANGSGDVYQAGDTIANIVGGETITLYAQWTQTEIPAVSATLQYDENTGEEDSLPEDATTTFQPSQTGTISVSDAIPTKEADAYYTYTFKEWNTQANGNGTVYHPEDTVNNLAGGSTTTLYAQWNRTAIAPVSATLHYNANTGNTSSIPTDQTTSFQPSETGSLTVSNVIPTKNADAYYTYTFKEWNTQVDGEGTVYEAGDEIDNLNGGDSVTLYAIWTAEEIEAVPVTVHYDANSGDTESVPEDDVDYFQPSLIGAPIVSSIIPTKEADAYFTYTFKEWNTQADGKGTVYEAEDEIEGLTANSTITLYAIWNQTAIPAVNATLQYDANTGNTNSLPTNTTISFQPSETGTITISDTIPTKNADAYHTYTFKEWNTKVDGSGMVYAAGDTLSNLAGGSTTTLYAIWNETDIPPVSASVEYDANTGDTKSLPVDETTTFQPSQSGTITLSDTIPTKNADAYHTYTFKEWNTKVDGSGMVYATGDTLSNLAGGSTTTLYAIWNEIDIAAVSASVEYDANTGDTKSLPVDETTTFQPSETGTITISDTIPTKNADAYHTYTFKEWNTKVDGSGMVYAAGDTLSNLAGGSTTTLYAIWNETDIAAVSASVEYDVNGGDTDSLPEDATISFQPSQTGTITLSDTIPTKNADAYHTYIFKEWNTKVDGSGMAYAAGDTLSNLIGGSTTTLYAIWNEIDIPPISVTVHYDANTGDIASVPVDDVDYFQPSEIGTPIVTSILPTKEADAYYTYTFKEWNTQADGEGTVYEAEDGIEGLTAGSTITLYAQWDKALKTSKVITRYVDTEGNQIAPEVVMSDEIGEKYTTEGLDKEMLTQGDIVYTLIETPINATGEYTPEEIVVTYIYEKSKDIQDIPSKQEEVSDTTKKTPETADGTNSSILMVMFIGSMILLGEIYINYKKKI